MENLTITKTPKGKEFLYEVFAGDQKIGSRRSPRTYVAAAVRVPGMPVVTLATDEAGRPIYNKMGGFETTTKPGEKFQVLSWIGREDLILSNADVKRGAKVARLVTSTPTI